MAGIDRWKISPEMRAKFAAILDEAPQLGIDRDRAAFANVGSAAGAFWVA